MASSGKSQGPDLTKGVSVDHWRDSPMLVGRVGDDDVLVARVGTEFLAVSAHCTHYHGALGEGLIVGDTVRCPLHHACFSLRTGDALRAPALDSIACWKVERRGESIFVHEKLTPKTAKSSTAKHPESVVIIGGGAAGLAAAEMLRHDGFAGPVIILSADQDPPVDRPNLSKDYLAGEAQEDWIPMRPAEFYQEHKIEVRTKTRVTAIDPAAKHVEIAGGARQKYGALLIATGAEPVKLSIRGATGDHVHYLRTLADSKAIITKAKKGSRAVVIGASFIGLEVAASLRTREVHVDVVAPDQLPLAKVMGPELGRVIHRLHEQHGVTFHLGQTVTKIDGRKVTLSGGSALEADFVVVGVGVRPVVDLAEKAGLATDKGITVNEFMETSQPGIFAAGDVARWRDAKSGASTRVEHWVVAERQGQVAAKNILGTPTPFDSAPFFWSQHYDTTIRYVGHVDAWDAIAVDGDPAALNCRVSFRRVDRERAVATIGRDRECLEAEVALEASTPEKR
jgi:NADPH-dependent 2,4-dienoyl-CoA reductase/sulfur reductase-like enzyme/nitrite reductase/ring-hydroxylating ferredoxin subunit